MKFIGKISKLAKILKAYTNKGLTLKDLAKRG